MMPEADDGSLSTASSISAASTSSSSTSSAAENADLRSKMAAAKGEAESSPASKSSNGSSTSRLIASNAKDPLRPRRKKARRACFACQRAHLTCGDERPCQRCIKRGLQDSCHDGMRKKAKYLHDAPPEALIPSGIGGGHFTPISHMTRHPPMSSNLSSPDMGAHPNASVAFFSPHQPNPSVYGVFPPNANHQIPMAPPIQDFSVPIQSSPLLPVQHTQLHNLACSLPPTTQSTPVLRPDGFGGPLYDPNDPTLFNFDLASLNFGNHYGALEFGMLGHMSSGAADLSPGDQTMPSQSGLGFTLSHNSTSSGYMQSPESNGFGGGSYNPDTSMDDWSQSQPISSTRSPSRQDSIGNTTLYPRPSPTSSSLSTNPLVSTASAPLQSAFSRAPSSPPLAPAPRSTSHQHPRDPSTIYLSTQSPYSYTAGFHRLTSFLSTHFPPPLTLSIAKSLASIRPSFISCTKSLNRHDLVFMEQCFQRTLWEYEDLINQCGTPTLVCRRTGEVAAVGREFSVMTGWSRGVLLGEEPRDDERGLIERRAPLRVARNGGGLGIGHGSGLSAGRSITAIGTDPKHDPRPDPIATATATNLEEEDKEPVFLAELLDEESVVEFYEDFAKLAFGDSRGCVQRRGRVLTYKPKGGNGHGLARGKKDKGRSRNGTSRIGAGTQGRMDGLVEGEDGRIECTYCWTVKRDMFDIPMLIVINFLPCIYD